MDKPKHRRRQNASRRGERAAIAFQEGRGHRGNPYDWSTQLLEHEAWARAYMRAAKPKPVKPPYTGTGFD